MTAAVTPAPSMFAVFRRRDFSLLWLAQLISTAGSSLTDLAAGIWVYRETHSALAVGLTLMATAIPSLIVGLLAGVYVDRHDRQRIMTVTCLVQAVIVGLIAFVIGLSSIALVGLYVLLLANAGVKQFFDPAHIRSSRRWPATRSSTRRTRSSRSPRSARPPSASPVPASSRARSGSNGRSSSISISFVVAAALIALMGRYTLPIPDEDATPAVILANLRSGMSTLFGTPILRSLFLIGSFMFVAFGLWNVLLLPFSITVLGATEFEYGLQEGLTSVGFVVGSLFMARFAGRLPEPVWIVISLVGMGIVGIAYGLSSTVPVAILLVAISGFLQPASSVSRCRAAAAEHAARDARPRLLVVLRHARRDLPDRHGRRRSRRRRRHPALIVVASSAAVRLGASHGLRPGSRLRDLGRSPRRGCGARAGRRRGGGGPARDARRLRPARRADRRRSDGCRPSSGRPGRRRRRSARSPAGTRIVEHGDAATRRTSSSTARRLRASRTATAIAGLSTMGAGDFFGEIAALTGSRRTADVVADVDTTLLEVPADALRATMEVPEIAAARAARRMTSRLQRTEAADLPRLAGVDQADLRDLRTPRPTVEALPADVRRRRRRGCVLDDTPGGRPGGGRTHRPAVRYGGRRRARRPGRTAATGHASHRGMRRPSGLGSAVVSRSGTGRRRPGGRDGPIGYRRAAAARRAGSGITRTSPSKRSRPWSTKSASSRFTDWRAPPIIPASSACV